MRQARAAWRGGQRRNPVSLIELKPREIGCTSEVMTKVLSWNMRRPRGRGVAWAAVDELAPDLALLQEVGQPPDIDAKRLVWQPIPGRRWGSAIYAKEGIELTPLDMDHSYPGWVAAADARREDGSSVTVISLHARSSRATRSHLCTTSSTTSPQHLTVVAPTSSSAEISTRVFNGTSGNRSRRIESSSIGSWPSDSKAVSRSTGHMRPTATTKDNPFPGAPGLHLRQREDEDHVRSHRR
jgi:hypothetical protein